MKLIEALTEINSAATRTAEKQVYLACGFTPLHFQTFLTAHLQKLTVHERIVLRTGAFDDLIGNLDRMAASGASLGVCVVEWPDLDPRLGVRRLSSWSFRDFDQIESSVQVALSRLAAGLRNASRSLRVVIALPTLPLLPVAYSGTERLGVLEARLRSLLADLASNLAGEPRIVVFRGEFTSPTDGAFDIDSAISTGFPYRMAHADILADAIAPLALPRPRKKGIITDLDDTLWKGLIGEVGPADVAWDMEHHAQVHGLYQQLLHWLAAEGVLVGVASKNAPDAVMKAFEERRDLLVKREDVFPFEIHWNSKADSVGRILQQWNIAADAVVFVDDSPLELAEVAAAHPGIETRQFSAKPGDFLHLWRELRELFAAETIGAEDAVRAQSLRQGAKLLENMSATTNREDFLSQLEARIRFEFSADATNRRALELVNKTNQFNINGRRFDESTWSAMLAAPNSFLFTCTYEDKFGPLGTIAVAQGQLHERRADLRAWVLSCRAFSRRIEFAMLQELIRQFDLEQLDLDYHATDRNGPVREFLEALGLTAAAPVRIERAQFESTCPKLYHAVDTHVRLDDKNLHPQGKILNA